MFVFALRTQTLSASGFGRKETNRIGVSKHDAPGTGTVCVSLLPRSRFDGLRTKTAGPLFYETLRAVQPE
jgi:hypothetical protein